VTKQPFRAPPGEPIPDDCTTCGACCFSRAPDYLRVFGADHERLGDHAEKLTHFLGNRMYMRLEHGHCAALTVVPGTGQYLCSIYERRPDVCRWLERGSGHCRAERVEKLERARDHLVELRRKPTPTDPQAVSAQPASAESGDT
jgi:Fe-S-cluster containining protein